MSTGGSTASGFGSRALPRDIYSLPTTGSSKLATWAKDITRIVSAPGLKGTFGVCRIYGSQEVTSTLAAYSEAYVEST